VSVMKKNNEKIKVRKLNIFVYFVVFNIYFFVDNINN